MFESCEMLLMHSLMFWDEQWQSLQMYMMHLPKMWVFRGAGGVQSFSGTFCFFIPNDILTEVLQELLLGDPNKLSLLR